MAGSGVRIGAVMGGAKPAELSEKDWHRQVQDLARIYGWEMYHPWLSIHSPRGFPDLALVRPPRLILAELKRQRGKTTPAQDHWLDLLQRCPGVEVHLWRPADLDQVVEVLR